MNTSTKTTGLLIAMVSALIVQACSDTTAELASPGQTGTNPGIPASAPAPAPAAASSAAPAADLWLPGWHDPDHRRRQHPMHFAGDDYVKPDVGRGLYLSISGSDFRRN